MKTWKYKTLSVPFSGGWGTPKANQDEVGKVLDHCGREGWELVSVVTTNQENGRSGELIFFLKRADIES